MGADVAFSFLIELVLLAVFCWLWWAARRDLSALAGRNEPAPTELGKVRENIEQLISVLEERAESTERGLRALLDEAREAARHIEDATAAAVAALESGAQERPAKVAGFEEMPATFATLAPSSAPPAPESLYADPASVAQPPGEALVPPGESDQDIELEELPSVAANGGDAARTALAPAVIEAGDAREDLDFRPYAIKPVPVKLRAGPDASGPIAPAAESPAEQPSASAPVESAAEGLARAEEAALMPVLAPDGSAAAADPAAKAAVDPYQAVYTLTELGITDVSEIARRTGLGQSEVEMVLSLWKRK